MPLADSAFVESLLTSADLCIMIGLLKQKKFCKVIVPSCVVLCMFLTVTGLFQYLFQFFYGSSFLFLVEFILQQCLS